MLAISLGMTGAGKVFNPGVRFLAYFFLVFVAMAVLRQLPVLGGVFRIPLLGFFLAAVVVSAVVAKGGEALARRAKLQRQLRELGEVDTPQRRGKLGRLLLQHNRPAAAVEHLRAAIAADPELVDWHYRLGMALLQAGDREGALESLLRARDLDEGFAYGGVLLQLSEAARVTGDLELALGSLERFEVLEGPNPEQAYRKGRVYRALGRPEEARATFDSIPALVKQVPGYQKTEARAWALRGFWTSRF